MLRMSAPTSCSAALSGCAARRGIALRVAAPARPLHARRRSSGVATLAVLDITEANFEAEVLNAKLPVLVDFWASWCGPCKLVAPSMVWAEKEYAGRLKVVKVEADPNPKLIEKYKVYGLPALIVFKGGKPVENSKYEGAVTKKALVKYLAKAGIPATVPAA